MLRNANDLDVTDEQIDQIESILENARPRFEALGEQLRTQRDAWQESNDPAVFDEAATRQFAENQAALHANLMVHQMQTRAAVLSVLTPEQRETLQQIRSEMQGRRGGKKHSKPCR
jgi:Spy/CpxP family protein refolding chaperone